MGKIKDGIGRKLFQFFFLALFLSVSAGNLGAGVPPGIVVFAINCGGPAYTDKAGIVYQADTYFSGGQTYKTNDPIEGTNDGTLYQTERWGKFSYAIPVVNGDYTVTLKFAEIYAYGKWAGMRVFNVKIEGKKVIGDLDLVLKAGQYRAYDLSYPVKVEDGVLRIDFYNQKETAKVNAILISKEQAEKPENGTITGKVSDSTANIPLPLANVSITDSSNIPKAGLTDNKGEYKIPEIVPGDYKGKVFRDGYKPYEFRGNILSGQILTKDASLKRELPVVSRIEAIGITTESAVVTWETDQDADSLVEYGLAPSYGSSEGDSALIKSHRIPLKNLLPEKTYHYRVTSKNIYGFSSSSDDKTLNTLAPANPITLKTTYPGNGDTIPKSDVRVEGTVINSTGSETGVGVNGILATVAGDRFTANHVPLLEGTNTITAVATDIKGNTANDSIDVKGQPKEHYIRIAGNMETGILPLEVILTVDSDLDLATVNLTYLGPGEVELVKMSENEYQANISAEGIYTFTANIADSTATLFEDSAAVTVFSREQVDGLFRAKWGGIKEALANQDVEGAIINFSDESMEVYKKQFTALKSLLPDIIENLMLPRFIWTRWTGK